MGRRESHNRELKQEISDSFLKTVSAFANYDGGRILFGVADDGTDVGLEDPEKAALAIEHKINDCIDPQPDYLITIADNGVITLDVRKGTQKPYLYRSKAYKRNGTSTIQVDSVELRRLALEGENLTFDALPCPETSLSFNALSRWLNEKLHIGDVTDDILKTLGLLTLSNRYTNAGALLADENRFPGIDAVRFGANINRIFERERVERVSILTLYEAALSIYRRYYQYEEIVGAERVRRERVPETAFREAIANGLVHRTWDVAAQIRIEMYEDRVEIVSPGDLPTGVSDSDYLEGELSLLRNPLIGNVFFRLGIIEQFGTGVRRIRESYGPYDSSPEFHISEQSIRIVLPVTDRRIVLTGDEEQVIALLSDYRALPSREIADRLGFGKDKALKILKALADNRLVEIQGSGRSTRYRLFSH